jgi:hypothetical protein
MTKPGRKKSMGDFMREVHRVPFKAYQLPADRAQRAGELCHARRDLLVLLATYANTDGTSVRPAMEPTLTSELGWSRATIYRRLADLQALGFINETGRNEDTGIREWSIDLVVLSHESRTGETLSSLTSRVPNLTSSLTAIHDPSRPQLEATTTTTTTTTTVSKNQMEGELLAAWNSYREAFDDEETLSPPRKRLGLETLRKLRERFPKITSEECVDGMTGAIDRVRHLVKTQPKKAYLANWFRIFGNFEKFLEYWAENE